MIGEIRLICTKDYRTSITDNIKSDVRVFDNVPKDIVDSIEERMKRFGWEVERQEL
jgi:hypothetical protein